MCVFCSPYRLGGLLGANSLSASSSNSRQSLPGLHLGVQNYLNESVFYCLNQPINQSINTFIDCLLSTYKSRNCDGTNTTPPGVQGAGEETPVFYTQHPALSSRFLCIPTILEANIVMLVKYVTT